MRRDILVPVLATFSLLPSAASARTGDIESSVILSSAVFPARAAPATDKAPDTPAGRALTEFVDSFNAGGKTRQTWLETRTTVGHEWRASLLENDTRLLHKFGALSVVRIVSSSPESVAAVVRYGMSGSYGYLRIAVQTTEPRKVVNIDIAPPASERSRVAPQRP